MESVGKLSSSEESKNKRLMREKDRERKRAKRMNPEYRKLEQERDRDRKKIRRSNEAFRQLEKLRDRIRKERKKGIYVDESMPTEFIAMPNTIAEPEVIISTADQCQTTSTGSTTTGGGNNSNTNNTHSSHSSLKNLYPPASFHHPLPIAGVTLMPQLCHPILHQNMVPNMDNKLIYPNSGLNIKQELAAVGRPTSSGGGVGSGGGGGGDDHEVALIEPEIILSTSADVISAPHHFHNHAHTHHLHQQQCSMFQHMPHIAHMRSASGNTNSQPVINQQSTNNLVFNPPPSRLDTQTKSN